MKSLKYFTIAEMQHSEVAIREGITNRIPSEGDSQVWNNLVNLITDCLDPIREVTECPIIVTSGYRSPALNKRIGGAYKSQHMEGEAADIVQPGRTAQELYEIILRMENAGRIEYDQLILEYNRWVHISYRKGKNRLQHFIQK